MALRDDLIARDWSQGRLIREADHPQIVQHLDGTQLPAGYRLMVITQTCDLLYDRLDAEPVAELLIVAVTDGAPDGNYAHCRSTRLLHVPITTNDGATKCVKAKRVDVRAIPRDTLRNLDADPALRLSPRGLKTLQRWLALRYARAALPDAFEDRYRPAKNKIRDALKQVPHELEELFIAITDEELPAGTPYNIKIYGVMNVDNYGDDAKKDKATEAMERLAQALEGCDGIAVLDYEVRSANEISLDDLEELARWNFIDLSLSADPPADGQVEPPGL